MAKVRSMRLELVLNQTPSVVLIELKVTRLYYVSKIPNLQSYSDQLAHEEYGKKHLKNSATQRKTTYLYVCGDSVRFNNNVQ